MSVFYVGDIARCERTGLVGVVVWSDPDFCVFDIVYSDGSFEAVFACGPSEFEHVDLVTALGGLA